MWLTDANYCDAYRWLLSLNVANTCSLYFAPKNGGFDLNKISLNLPTIIVHEAFAIAIWLSPKNSIDHGNTFKLSEYLIYENKFVLCIHIHSDCVNIVLILNENMFILKLVILHCLSNICNMVNVSKIFLIKLLQSAWIHVHNCFFYSLRV